MFFFDNDSQFSIVDTITPTSIIARGSSGPIMNKFYVTSPTDAMNLFANGGDCTPNISWGILDFDNFDTTNNNLNYDLLAKIGEPRNFYTFGKFCVLLTCLNGRRGMPYGIKPIAPNAENTIQWKLSNNELFGTAEMTLLTNKNFAIYIQDTKTYYRLTFSIWQSGGGGHVAYTRTLANNTCFKEDTKILTDKGYIPIQYLRKGNLIKTLKHDYKPINMIGKIEIYHSASEEGNKNQLYVCSQDNYPDIFEDLIITGCHSILVDNFTSEEQKEKVIEVNGNTYVTDGKYRLPVCTDPRASVYENTGSHTIYHLALDNDNYYMNYGIYANGLLVETCSKRYLKELSNMTLI